MAVLKVDVSYPAGAQLQRLPKADQAALKRLFHVEEITDVPTTRRTSDGRFVSNLGNRRVLWRQRSRNGVEILSVVDSSFAQKE
jgi:hypothetical protein